MPYKSKAQRRKFWALVAKGKMPAATAKAWESKTTPKNLPERVVKKAYVTGANNALLQLGLRKR